MQIERRYTKANQSAYEGIEFRQATSEIRNPDGSVVFKLENIDVPASWSQVASDIIAQKYFRKAGVPKILKKVEENSVPSWLWKSEADKEAWPNCPKTSATARKWMPGRSSTASQAPGPIGAGKVAISTVRKTPHFL